MRYRLRTLLIVLALGPPVLAGGYAMYRDSQFFPTILAVAMLALFVSGHLYLAIHLEPSIQPPSTPE